MRNLLSVTLVTLLMAALAGCGPNNQTQDDPPPPKAVGTTSAPPPSGTTVAKVPTGAPLGSVKIGDKVICAVCAVKDAKPKPEEVKATLDYKGKTYAFCKLEEKAEFISNPPKYAGGSK